MAAGYDDAAMAALGIINAGVQAYGGANIRKKQKKAKKIQQGDYLRKLAEQQRELDENKVDVNYGFDANIDDISEDTMDRGVYHSGIRTDAIDEQNYLRNRRLSALDRQKASLAAGGLTTEKLWTINDQIDKTQNTMALISAALMQGATGVGQVYGATSA